jgi:hypothetical protein
MKHTAVVAQEDGDKDQAKVLHFSFTIFKACNDAILFATVKLYLAKPLSMVGAVVLNLILLYCTKILLWTVEAKCKLRGFARAIALCVDALCCCHGIWVLSSIVVIISMTITLFSCNHVACIFCTVSYSYAEAPLKSGAQIC